MKPRIRGWNSWDAYGIYLDEAAALREAEEPHEGWSRVSELTRHEQEHMLTLRRPLDPNLQP